MVPEDAGLEVATLLLAEEESGAAALNAKVHADLLTDSSRCVLNPCC